MAKDPAFLMYYKKWIVSTAGWDADVRGWYINLLCHQADKPEGLPSDLESLAEFAGVKISQFDRFRECWKRTLEAKFKKGENGLLLNLVQDKVIKDRKQYTEKQATRGLIGYYIKLARRHLNITEDQAGKLYEALLVEDLNNKNKEDQFLAFKRTLEALMINVDLNVIVDLNKGVLRGNQNFKTKRNGKTESSGYNFAAQGENVFANRFAGHNQADGS